jgi:hypothetical protein
MGQQLEDTIMKPTAIHENPQIGWFSRLGQKLSGLGDIVTDNAGNLPATQTAPAALGHRQRRGKYPYSLNTSLLKLSRFDHWLLGEALEGTVIYGEPGAGKSSGSGEAIARAVLEKDVGMVITSHKSDERQRWARLCKETGRLKDLIIVNPEEKWRCNLLEYLFTRPGEGAGQTQNTVDMFLTLAESRSRGGRRTQQDFWTEASGEHLGHCLNALVGGGELITLDNLNAVLAGMPVCKMDGKVAYPEGSLLKTCLDQADRRERQGEPMIAPPQELRIYFERKWAAPGADRMTAGIDATLRATLTPLNAKPIKDLFFSSTNFLPDFCRQGAIILLDLPVLEWEQIGRMSQIMFRYVAMRSVLRRQGLPKGERPVIFWSDEYANFVTDLDRMFAEGARSSWGSMVCLVQNINSLHAAADPQQAQAHTNALLATLSTKIFHRNSGETNQYAADLIGKAMMILRSGSWSSSKTRAVSISGSQGKSISMSDDKAQYGGNQSSSWNLNRSDGFTSGGSWSEHIDYPVLPFQFTQLASGGAQFHKRVEAIVFKSGRPFKASGGFPYLGVTFRQK